MNRNIAAIIGAILGWGVSATNAAEAPDVINKPAAKVAVELCSSYHGPGGSSISPTFPKLAGRQQMYLAGEIGAFKARSRVISSIS